MIQPRRVSTDKTISVPGQERADLSLSVRGRVATESRSRRSPLRHFEFNDRATLQLPRPRQLFTPRLRISNYIRYRPSYSNDRLYL